MWLEQWAIGTPDRLVLQERGPDGQWRGPTWKEARDTVHRIAAWLAHHAPSTEHPVVILSDNSVEQAMLTLAALHVGIPVAPVSPAYSTQSRDFAKLRTIIELLDPGLVYAADGARYGPALEAIRPLHRGHVVAGDSFTELLREADEPAVAARFAGIGPDTVAKLLFTSGSTGEPKGVINTQGMLCANQQARLQVWPFLLEEPPVLVEWLPWSHTFGGNHNFNVVLRHGGTLYIDGGRPIPQLFGQTVANLREVAPTIYFNVPRGYDLLVTALENDAVLRERFFSRIQIVFTAAAALPPHLWEALRRLAREATDRPIFTTSAWGSTETAPLAADCHWQAEQSGVIGLPVPGTELKLVPAGGKLEVRVRGPNVTPGYWRRPELAATHWDDEGFYRIGDALRWVDPARPEQGLLFDGRVAEDFKLDTGTWVSVGMLRVKAIAALAPVAQDIVVAGHDRPEVGFLIFPNVVACRQLASLPPDAPVDQVLAATEVRAAVKRGLAALREAGGGSSAHGTRAILLGEAPSIDHGEITDKGYLNQRAVLTRRTAQVEALFAGHDDSLIRL